MFALAAVLVATLAVLAPQPAAAQTTISTGSIQGTVTDPSGAAVPGAKIAITNKDTGQVINLTTTSSGLYTSGALSPGSYTVRVEAQGFKTTELPVTVQLGVTSSGNVQMQVGAASTVVQVTESAVSVNTEQATVQGVLNADQIESLPINGRNFLDLAGLEPGVQLQDGFNFDPTKVGFSSISFGGRYGRTARIEVDGVDVSDETVGTTTENIPAGALREFQISQSSLDLSTELTSSGSVQAVTKSGSNAYHGEALYLFRDSRQGAALPGPKSPYQRNHIEANAGGPVIKDKLFFFGDYLRIKQDLFAPVPEPDPFTAFSGGFSSPFRENDLFGRLDWQATSNLKMFYRYSYFSDLGVSTFGAISFQPFKDKNYTRQHVVGADFHTGSFTHSIRFSYLKFQNTLVDDVLGSNLPLASFPLSINVGLLSTGPNLLAPQTTPQSNRQIKYDGSKIVGAHIFRYGIDFNHLQGGGFAKFFSITPSVFDSTGAPIVGAFTCPNGTTGANCPLNYQVQTVLIGNGEGFSTESRSFGYPAGGLGPDNRFGVYVGDSWKVKPNLTLSFGLRYSRDTGRTDSDLPPIGAVNAIFPGLGNRVNQANGNLGPQVGLAWDPWKNGKTSVRAGIGLYYENVIWNNVLFDRPLRLPKGAFLDFPAACSGGTPVSVTFADGTQRSLLPAACTGSIGAEAATIAAFQSQFQAVAASVGTNATNAAYLPNRISSAGLIPLGLFAPGYKTPRSVQMNVGIQREIRPGMVLSVDYVRNVVTHYLLSVDANHTGDAAFLNKTAALAAITATNAAFACPAGTAGIPCAITAGATISNYANHGLDSPIDQGVGACGVALGFDCAFAGLNPNVGQFPVLFPIGRSVYNALDFKLRGDVNNPLRGVKRANFQFAYALSRFINSGGAFAFNTSAGVPGNSDQDFVIPALDNRNPLRYTGDSTLDRRHQFSFGGLLDLPLGFRISTIFHFDSPLANTIYVPSSGGFNATVPGEIFRTDFTGSGAVGDPLPGTKAGSFGRDVSGSNVNNFITNYNNTIAGNITPAGQALVNAGLFTTAQLKSLGAVAPTVPLAPSGQVGLDWLRTFDLRIGWVRKFRERYAIEPSVNFYNLFNFANFDPPGATLDGFLTGLPGSSNGTTYNGQVAQRIGVGTGVFGVGAPRAIEFGLRVSF